MSLPMLTPFDLLELVTSLELAELVTSSGLWAQVLYFLLVGHAKANKKQHKDHSHCTKWMSCKKCNKFLFPFCTNLKDTLEDEKQDTNKI
eukprot:8907796-Ditylum_brightwellii.AAC.1